MSNYYVRSGATGAADGSTWADAYTNVPAALAVAVSGDTLWVANDHSYDHAGTFAWTGPTTGVGVRILGVNTNSVEPPTGLADPPTAIEVAGTGSANTQVFGRLYIESMAIKSTTSSSGATALLLGNDISTALHFKNCHLWSASVNGAAQIFIGCFASASQDDNLVVIEDSVFRFANTTRGISLRAGRIRIRGCTLDAAGATPATLIGGVNGTHAEAVLDASDLSAVAWDFLYDVSNNTSSRLLARNLKLPSGTTASTGTSVGPGGGNVFVHNAASGDVYTNMVRAEHAGTQVEETTLVRTGGSDVSYRIDTNANAAYPNVPFTSSEGAMYNSVTTEQTLIVEILHDTNVAAGQGSGTDFDFTNAEVYLRVMALTTSGFPLGEWMSDAPASVFATPTDQDASSEAWTTTGMTTPVKQALAVTFTAAEAGYLHWEICVAAASKTLYADLSSPTLS